MVGFEPVRYAPVRVTARPVVPPGLGQPAILKPEDRNPERYRTVSLFATGGAALLAGAQAFSDFNKKGNTAHTVGYLASAFSVVSAVLFGVILIDG